MRRRSAAAVAVEPPGARPLLKWPGGKAWATDELVRQIGIDRIVNTERYYEPFMGGAALFWQLRTLCPLKKAIISDANEELVNCYRVVRDNVECLIVRLGDHVVQYALMGADWYYKVRSMNPIALDGVNGAARTIFLNKTGFNGLYRVNRAGGFNVPHGRTASGKPPVICDAGALRACSKALQGVELKACDWLSALIEINGSWAPKSGDMVYLDSPYDGTWTGYTSGGFGAEDQVRLADRFRELAARGVYVVASNSATPKIRELYRGFRQIDLARPGGMNSDPTKRGKVKELLMLGWERT